MEIMKTLENENRVEISEGIAALASSLNECVNLFFQVGAMRGKDKNALLQMFSKAYSENPLVATKVLFWARDARGGAGERQIFRDILEYLVVNSTDVVRKNLSLIPEFGRWDDILLLVGTEVEGDVFDLIKTELDNENGLCSKWMPRKGKVANAIRRSFKVSPKVYRKTLVELTSVIETAMCAKDYSGVDYSKLPSLASSRYQKAFLRNDEVGYGEYKTALESGEAKVNAGAVYPYDIIKSMNYGGDKVVNNAQWESLPNFMEGSEERVLPVVDVSGSMSCSAGGNDNLTCMDVAISLGMYISERNEGNFKDAFVTFSSNPQLQYLKGTLEQRLNQLRRAEWGMSTDINAVFELILNQAKMYNIPQDKMPTKILILSDMQFNSATNSRWGNQSDWNPSAQDMIESKYEDAGYNKPDVVYWNLNASMGNFPVEFDKMGTAMVSGFSPSILKSLLSGKSMTPESILMETVGSERYSLITI
tara:strand:- start:632 stop:2065 length:1434 start_codon:yes stop_codon:yes gene_type:complete